VKVKKKNISWRKHGPSPGTLLYDVWSHDFFLCFKTKRKRPNTGRYGGFDVYVLDSGGRFIWHLFSSQDKNVVKIS
jgi:hypothetical protein